MAFLLASSELCINFLILLQVWGYIKTHILGCPCGMISSPEAARLLLVSRAHLFKPTYPPSKEKMKGPEAIFFHQGAYHSRLKKLVQASFLPSAIRGTVSEIENIVLKLIPTWNNCTICTLQEMKRVCRFVTLFLLLYTILFYYMTLHIRNL